MPTRFIYQGAGAPGGVGRASGISVDTQGVLRLNRGVSFKGAAATDRGGEPIGVQRVIELTAAGTLTPADTGALVIADAAASVIVSLPATQKGLTYTLTVAQLPTSGAGVAFSPVAADKIMGNGVTPADNKDLVCVVASDRIGDSVTLVGDGVDGWYVTSVTGTWTREA